MNIQEIQGEYGRYLVESRSTKGEFHMVDLTENFPLGRCDCTWYRTKVWPQFRLTKEQTFCAHLFWCHIHHSQRSTEDRLEQELKR